MAVTACQRELNSSPTVLMPRKLVKEMEKQREDCISQAHSSKERNPSSKRVPSVAASPETTVFLYEFFIFQFQAFQLYRIFLSLS